jgi:hypothetical protein
MISLLIIYVFFSVESPSKLKRKVFLSYVHSSCLFFLSFIPFVHLSLTVFLIFFSRSFHLSVVPSFLILFLPFVYERNEKSISFPSFCRICIPVLSLIGSVINFPMFSRLLSHSYLLPSKPRLYRRKNRNEIKPCYVLCYLKVFGEVRSHLIRA